VPGTSFTPRATPSDRRLSGHGRCLEVNSQCAGEDDGECEGEVGEVDLAVGFGAGVESFEAAEPGVGAFDDPAVAGVRVACADVVFAAASFRLSGLLVVGGWVAGAAALADLRDDRPFEECLAQRVAAVAAVGPDRERPVAGRPDRVDQGEQVGAFVFVAGAEPDLERPAVRVDC
jgi:hypothetical protein